MRVVDTILFAGIFTETIYILSKLITIRRTIETNDISTQNDDNSITTSTQTRDVIYVDKSCHTIEMNCVSTQTITFNNKITQHDTPYTNDEIIFVNTK